MALKNKIIKSKEEQLYMLEAFVDQVTLNPEVPDINVKDLLVCVRFIDLPEYEIRVPQRKEAADQGYGSSENSEFRKSCLFAKTPSCLIRAIKWSPVYLDLYRKDIACSNKNGAFLGTAKLSLPACMRKQVIATQNNNNGLSAPCIVKDSFDIIDSNGETCANITVILRLSCLGSAIVEQFSLNGKSFMLEDSPLQKFLCPYIFPKSTKFEKDSKDENASDKPLLKRPESPPRIPMGHPAFKTLTTAEKLNDPKYREMIYSAYPNEPTCGCLPKDRSTHPMICPSGCTYCMKLRNPDILSKEENKRVEGTLANTYCVNNFLSALHTLKQDSPCNKPSRLKGGGDVEQIYVDPTTFRWTDYDVDYAWYDEKHNIGTRLVGGGEEKDTSNCSCSGSPVPVLQRKTASRDNDVVPIFDACTPRITSTGATPACICPGKDAKFPRGAAKCMKSPCPGIDCLIRAFKDAQDFVDSIGKVPGLPGLGLMDPSESPYFGRDIDKDYVPPDRPALKKKAPPGTLQVAATQAATPTCTAPCSVKLIDDMRPQIAPYSPPITRGIVPPRLGIVREAIPVLPEAGLTTTPVKHRKKEEKKDEKTDKQKELEVTSSVLMDSEVGPCGEPRCKSRRRKPQDNSSVTLSTTHVSSKTRTGVKRAAASPKARHKAKKGPKRELRRRGPQSKYDDLSVRASDHPIRDATSWRSEKAHIKKREKEQAREKSLGPGGDRHVPGSTVTSQLPIPVSRRVMRYVYFVGDYYPGINFGHRNCIDIPMRVPANMGWLWNTMDTAAKLKPRIGWRPGAIGRYLHEMLQDAKEITIEEMEEEKARIARAERRRTDRSGTDRAKIDRGRADRGRIDRGRIDRGKIDRGRVIERARSVPSRSKSVIRRQRTGRTISYQAMQKQSKMEGEEEGPEFPPTLHIHRKDGTYYVTMYPIRQETSIEPRLSEPMKPLQFKIVKNKDDASDTSSSTASDMEIEFSPPAAVTRPRKKPDVVHVDTQVRQQEILDAYKIEDFKKKSRRITRRKKDSKVLIKK